MPLTPLEELQAAHKRLSELRTGSVWVAGDNDYENHAFSVETANGDSIAESFYLTQRDLIVTLHRTIDAQLAMLDDGISLGTPPIDFEGEARKWWLEQPLDQAVLALARAINGTK